MQGIVTVDVIIRADARRRARPAFAAAASADAGSRPRPATIRAASDRLSLRWAADHRLGLDRRPPRRDPARGSASTSSSADRGRDRVRRSRSASPSGPVRRPSALRAGHRGHGHPVHDPEPRGVRRSSSGHRVLARHRLHPAHHVHAADPVPEHRGRVPRRPDRTSSRRPTGWATPGASGCRGSSCRSAMPLIIAGIRLATRHADRPRHGRLDPRRSLRRARAAHHRGPPDVLPDRSTCSAPCSRSLLAFVGDFLLVRLERPLTPWARARRGQAALMNGHRLVHRPRQLAGRDRDPVPAPRAPRDLPALVLAATLIALPIGLWIGHTGRGATSRSTSRTSAAPSRRSRSS